jgi:protein involved in polysaccharide export with SLBB domain
MKKILLLLCFLLPPLVSSQEISEAYLESLPESVKEDVLKQMDSKEANDKPIYKRPSTMVSKEDSEFSKYKEFKDLKKDKNIATNVRFGTHIFQSVQSSFMPINEPNLDGSYILDFGDTLEVQLIGQENSTEEVSVNRDGSINIPEIGKIFVAGLSLETSSLLIKNKIKDLFMGVESFISLINIRDIQILISGNAYNPGMYTLNGNSSILHAISMAGGIDDAGSYREVKLIRDNKEVATLDLYDVFISGKSNLTTNLRSGDTIHITQHQNLVHAVSGINRPMIYELKHGETFTDLIKYANGLKSTANTEAILIEGIRGGEIIASSKTLQELSSLAVKNNDSMIIGEFIFGKVEVKGAVKMPGYYKITEDTSLKSVLKRAGGFKNTAYPFGGHLDNKKTSKLNQEAKDKLYNNFIKDLITGYEILDESALEILESLKETDSSGRVMAEFDIDVLESNPNLDTRLDDGDVILIPYVTEQVYVYGETNSQGTVKYVPGKNPAYYIKNAGGYLKTADTKGLYIIHPNGETISIDDDKFLGLSIGSDDELVYPGSIIFVPQKSNLNAAKTASIWAPIISSIALSLTSLSVLNNN